MRMQNAMRKKCNAMRWALTKSANVNAMRKSFRTTIPGITSNFTLDFIWASTYMIWTFESPPGPNPDTTLYIMSTAVAWRKPAMSNGAQVSATRRNISWTSNASRGLYTAVVSHRPRHEKAIFLMLSMGPWLPVPGIPRKTPVRQSLSISRLEKPRWPARRVVAYSCISTFASVHARRTAGQGVL